MQSILLISQDKKNANDYITKFCGKEKIDTIDTTLNSFEKAIGIEDVRNIRKSIFLKPFKSKTKAIIIEAYEGITTESQNALLKILEEPPNNTIIIVVISKQDIVLPTILSRCKIVELKEEKSDFSDNDTSKLNDYFNILLNGEVGDKLKLAQDIAKNKEADAELEKITVFVRKKLIENYNDPKYLNFLKQLQKTYSIIKSTNVNQRIALENLFLSF